MYCGNNARDERLVAGDLVLGTRHGCMRKGVGVGLNMETDPSYRGEYEPIDETRIYCGNAEQLPEGYDRYGSLTACLQKGVAIGKRIKATRDDDDDDDSDGMIWDDDDGKSDDDDGKSDDDDGMIWDDDSDEEARLIPGEPPIPVQHRRRFFSVKRVVAFIISAVSLFIILYFWKPSFIVKKIETDGVEKTTIVWKNFLLIYIITVILSGIIITLTIK